MPLITQQTMYTSMMDVQFIFHWLQEINSMKNLRIAELEPCSVASWFSRLKQWIFLWYLKKGVYKVVYKKKNQLYFKTCNNRSL